jgi:CRP-like cAMP-binding protein
MSSRATRNSILESLPNGEFGKISRILESVPLTRDSALLSPGKRTEYLYFPTTAVISFVGETGEGTSIEVWSVGHEGAAGISGILGQDAPFSGVVQVSGDALRAKTSAIRKHYDTNRAFRQAITGYIHYLMTHISYLGICNNIHPLVQRFSRWLLVMEQRVGGTSLHFTQEGIAALLGTRRATISVAAAQLQAAGAIQYTPGAITITSRKKLRAVACKCYKSINLKLT